MKRKRGFVLLTVLSLSFVLLAIVSLLCKDAFFQMNKSVVFNSKNEAQMIAETGVSKAIFLLETKNGKPSPADWSGALNNGNLSNGTFCVKLWNNLGGATMQSVPEINDSTSKKDVPAKSLILESVGKTVNGYKKTVTTVVSYQLIPQMIDSEDEISISGNEEMSINLDSVGGFKPKIHSDAISKKTRWYTCGIPIFGVDSSIRLGTKVKVTAPQGSVFSTKSSFIDTDSANKIASLGNPPSQLLTNQPGRNYNISEFIKQITSNPGIEPFEIKGINDNPTKLEEIKKKFQQANGLVAKYLCNVNINDYVQFDSSGNFINDIETLKHVTFTGTFRGGDSGTLWASMEIDYTTKDPNGGEVSNKGNVWLAVSETSMGNYIPNGFAWDGKTLTIKSGGRFFSNENNSCSGALTLENLSLNIENDVEMYIGKKLTIKDCDVICDDNVDIFSSDDIILDNSTCRIGNPFNLEETNKVSIITNGDFIALFKGNPANNTGKYIQRSGEDGTSNYIKGSIYAKDDVIINGNDCALDMEGILISNGMFMMTNSRMDSSWDTYAPFLSSFTYNPYLAGQFLQDSLNSVNLQLEPLIWEVR